VGKGKQPLDLTREDHKRAFDESQRKWSEDMAHNQDNTKFGYIDISGLDLEPFGAAYGEAQAAN
jgi:hypothetical protein